MAGDPFRNEGGLACLVQGGPSRSPVRLRCSVPLDRLTWPSVVTSAPFVPSACAPSGVARVGNIKPTSGRLLCSTRWVCQRLVQGAASRRC